MNYHRVQLLCLLWLVVLLPASAQEPQPQAAALPVGQAVIAAIRGEVSFKSSTGAVLEASTGKELLPGSVIETAKGSAVLTLVDGSQVQIKAHSRVTLKDPAEQEHFSLQLLLGKLAAKIQKKIGATPSFRMGTPTAVITVRGTAFDVAVNRKGHTDVYVYQGMVEVFGIGMTAPPVLLGPGFGTGVDPHRPPQEPRQFMRPFEGDDDRSNRQRTPSSGSDDSSERRGTSTSSGGDRQQQSGSSESDSRDH